MGTSRSLVFLWECKQASLISTVAFSVFEIVVLYPVIQAEGHGSLNLVVGANEKV